MQIVNMAVIRIAPTELKFAYALLPVTNGMVSTSGKVFESDDDSQFPGLGLSQVVLASQVDPLKLIRLSLSKPLADEVPLQTLPFDRMTDLVYDLVYQEYLSQAEDLLPEIRKEIWGE